jgi:hypothetical protein
MSEEYQDRPVKITSVPRAHPAIRAIARACIALARWQREQEANNPPASAEQATTPHLQATKTTEEVRND